jgi:hypothetical protein
MQAGDMLSSLSLSVTTLNLKTAYIYREILFIVKRFDGEFEKSGEMGSHSAWIV